MTLIYYDADNSYGSGQVFIEGVDTVYSLRVWDKIIGDYNDADITSTFTSRSLVCRWRTYMKITNFGPLYPFTSTPEVRYKLGTFFPVAGYEVIIDESGAIVNPYQGTPGYLIYERQALPEYRIHVPVASLDFIDYSVLGASGSTVSLNAAIHDPTIDFFSFQGLETMAGLEVNLNDGVQGNLELYYEFFEYNFSNSETRPKVNITL